MIAIVFDAFKAFLNIFLEIGLFLLKFLLIFFVPFFLVGLFFFVYYYARGFRLKKRSIQINNSKRSFCRRLFIDFPQRFVLDLYNHNPDEFSYYGFWLFVGEQGSGKSISVVDFLRKIKAEYPYCLVKTNIDCNLQDEKIRSPHDIIFSDNGINGEIDFIDEIQNWFNSNESRDFPPEMIQEICQQRKQYKMLIGTSQKFNRLALPLREQVNFLCKPITLFGCLTVVRVYKPDVSDRDGKVSKQRLIRSYFFVHDDFLRSAYDTREKVKRLSMKGFKPRSERISSGDTPPAVDVKIMKSSK